MDQKIDDVSFISHLIDVMGASSFNVDLNRVYVMVILSRRCATSR